VVLVVVLLLALLAYSLGWFGGAAAGGNAKYSAAEQDVELADRESKL